MNKQVLSIFILLMLLCGSCQFPFFEKDFEQAPTTGKLREDIELLKKYMQIDKGLNRYVVCITEEERLEEGISEDNLKYMLGNVAELNKRISESVKKGEVVTLYLFGEDAFEAYTINKPDISEIDFEDVYIPAKDNVQTRAATLGYAYFNQGNWGSTNTMFEGSDHVTSALSVNSSTGYWQVSFSCYTGTTAYGSSFSAYGTGHTGGSIKRYWWWTNGGSAPFRWRFVLGGPPGGEANGNIFFTNT